MREAVGIIIYNKNGDLLLLQRSGAEESEKGKWSIVGGTVNPGESTTEAAIRQIREELRMLIEPQHLQLITQNPFSRNDQEVAYNATLFGLIPRLNDIPGIGEPHLTKGYRWVPKSELSRYDLASYTKDDLQYIGWA